MKDNVSGNPKQVTIIQGEKDRKRIWSAFRSKDK